MREIITILVLTLTTICFGQKGGLYTRFDSAFATPERVRVLSISCIDGNRYRATDNCDNLPDSIDKLVNLEELYISESSLLTLPSSINNLQRLKTIGLNNLRWLNYEIEICKLVGLDSLEYLGLWMGNIKQLPSCLTKIESLKEIDISFNEKLNVKHSLILLKDVSNLESINISGIDNFKVIPKEILEIEKLKSIQLNYLNDRFKYDKSFNILSSASIESLTLTNNWLDTIPQSITRLDQLAFIDLSDNRFKFIPNEIYNLKNLKYLKIQNNQHTLEIIGKDIQNLDKLERINLGNNWHLNGELAITNLSRVPNLNEVDFFGCRLDTIPKEITNFKSLERLNLTNNPKIDFSDLFKKLAKCETLKYLDISDNKLTTLPKEIGDLTSLEYLVIGQNPISSLPEELFKIKGLKVINVYGNYNTRINESEIEKIKQRLPNCKVIDEWVFRD